MRFFSSSLEEPKELLRLRTITTFVFLWPPFFLFPESLSDEEEDELVRSADTLLLATLRTISSCLSSWRTRLAVETTEALGALTSPDVKGREVMRT